MNKNDLFGKKLLILAGSCHEVELVRRAKELGVYTIVTDYYDTKKSPAKLLADEYWNISWSDIDTLAQKCESFGVDGITAGYSEFTVESLIKLCKKLDLPCYCNDDQLAITRDKIKFKQECIKHNIAVVNSYETPEEVGHFPVIVKPVDRAGSIGITIANDRDELKIAYENALEASVSKHVIIEDYIEDATKFDAYYAVTEGKINLLTTDDTIDSSKNYGKKVIQNGWLLPSKYQKKFIKTEHHKFVELIESLHIVNGYIFFSGFVKNGEFLFFETGFRLSGEHAHRYVCKKGNSDIQDIFIYNALGKTTDNLNFERIYNENLKGVIINFYADYGVVDKFVGIKEIEMLKECDYFLKMAHEGQLCNNDKAINTKLAMIHLYSNSPILLKEKSEIAISGLHIFDNTNREMIFDRLILDNISTWWD